MSGADRSAGPLIVAALSARWLAQAAAREGQAALALDAFGDHDTRAAAAGWWPLRPEPGGWAVTTAALVEALTTAQTAAAHPPAGWIAGPGLEAAIAGLTPATRAVLPPLIGNAPDTLRAVRDAATFFATLQRLGLPHPETRLSAPTDPTGWLRKDFAGSGGWHIAQAGSVGGSAGKPQAPARPGRHWQRQVGGASCSALFIADGRRARLLALQQQDVRPLGPHPLVLHGLHGPLANDPACAWARDPALQQSLVDAVQALTGAFGLVGLNGLDFMRADDAQGGGWQILELNPRPSASLALYPDWPWLRWHTQACGFGDLPGALPDALPPTPSLRGWRLVTAPHALRLSPDRLAHWATAPHHHDVPMPPAADAALPVAAGAPLLTVSAQADSADALAQQLAARAAAVLAWLPPVATA